MIGINFDIDFWGAACETCSATWNLGTNSAFALGSTKTTEKHLDGRSQDLPDANSLLADISEFKYWNPMLFAVLLLYFKKLTYLSHRVCFACMLMVSNGQFYNACA
jgi:hypothetical protein